MNNFVQNKLWAALQEAAASKDLAAVLEIYRLLANYTQVSEPETVSKVEVETVASVDPAPVTEVTSCAPKEKKTKDIISLPQYHEKTLKVLEMIEKDVMPGYACLVGDQSFTRGHFLRYMESNFSLSNAIREQVGAHLRAYFVVHDVTEILTHKSVRFTDAYLTKLREESKAMIAAADPDSNAESELSPEHQVFTYFVEKVIPRMVVERNHLKSFTLETLRDYFLRKKFRYPESDVIIDYQRLGKYLEEGGYATVSPPNYITLTSSFSKWISEKYVSVEDLNRMLASANLR